jgi:hypothetical protein
MTNFKLLGAAALSLLVAPPAVAAPQRDHHRYSYSHRISPVQHTRNFGYGSPYEAYGFDRGDDFARGISSGEFDRRNTFN